MKVKTFKYFWDRFTGLLFWGLFFNLIMFANLAQAAGLENLPGEDLSVQDVFNIITGLACWVTRTAVAVMVIFLVWAGLRFMAARGDPARWTTAKKNFEHVLWGILVIMGVYVIIATVANAVGASFSFIPLRC